MLLSSVNVEANANGKEPVGGGGAGISSGLIIRTAGLEPNGQETTELKEF